MKRVLVIDNFDSFTWNLVQMIREADCAEIRVIREDLLTPGDAGGADGIILSPGPGLPVDYPRMTALIGAVHQSIPVLGICLGHQAIAVHFGGRLVNLGRPAHGVAPLVHLTGTANSLFNGIPNSFPAGLYHSWAVSGEDLPACLSVDAALENGTIMALSHIRYNVKGVQFHPESVMSPHGKRLIRNWLSEI